MTKKKWVTGLLLLVAILATILLANCGQAEAPAPAEEAEAEEAEAEEAAEPEPAAEPEEEAEPVEVTAYILPYGIYPDMHVTDIEAWLAGEEVEAEEEAFAIRTTATNNVGTGTYVAAEAFAISTGESTEFTYEWSLAAADGSEAELLTGDGYAAWLADVGGDYVLTLTATDADGNSGTTTWDVHAGTYVGVGGVTGDAAAAPQCAACHPDKVEAWSATGHAMLFTEGINGVASAGYNAGCIECHTVGFYPGADNGGFDDLAAEYNWTFPAELAEGNWDAMVAEFPEVAALANIQCESCHGPGSDHMGTGPIGTGLSYGTCAQCHAEQTHHVYPMQWELSGHAAKDAMAFTYPIGEGRAACARCHSGRGYIDFVAGVPEEEQSTEYQIITCAVCHDPHDATTPHQLRTFDTVTLPDGTEVADAGLAATCMSCHNARTNAVEEVEEAEEPSWPHYSTAAELLSGTGGYTWGETLPNSPHGTVIEEACIGCHMAATPGMDDAGTPDDNSDDTPLPGHNTVGAHTFSMISSVDGTENVAACQGCHADLESFAFEAKGDYDGDGTVETNQDEVAGLQELLLAALVEKGVEDLGHHPYYGLPDGADTDLKGAVYNLKFSLSGGSTAHNLDYTVSLLQLSYEKLTGTPVPDADIIAPE